MFEYFENLNVYEFMTTAAHEIDFQNMETILRKGENVKQL
jgi:hypothetical protein